MRVASAPRYHAFQVVDEIPALLKQRDGHNGGIFVCFKWKYAYFTRVTFSLLKFPGAVFFRLYLSPVFAAYRQRGKICSIGTCFCGAVRKCRKF